MKSPNLVGLIESVLAESGLPASLLELEITETVAMENPQQTIENLRGLKRIGIRVSIDASAPAIRRLRPLGEDEARRFLAERQSADVGAPIEWVI